VVGVAAHPVTGELGVNLRAAPPRVLEFLEHHHCLPRQNESVAVPVPRTASRWRIVVARRQRARGGEPPHRGSVIGRSAPLQTTIAIAVFDKAPDSPMQCARSCKPLTIAKFGP